MTGSRIPDRRGRSLKVATADVVDMLHGYEAAASRIDRGKSHVHRCASMHDADTFLNLRDAVELQRFADRPLITMEMCRQAGGVFLQLPEAFGDDGQLPMHVVQITQELGDVSHSVCDALADGRVSMEEAAAIETQIDELIEVAVQARAHVRVLQGKNVVRPADAGALSRDEREAG